MSLDALPPDLPGLAVVVLLWGIRHGLDADHIATVDALTRLNSAAHPGLARRVGALFSLGHGAVVIGLSVVVAKWLSDWQLPGWLNSFGAWTSIAFLLALAVMNATRLLRAPLHGHVHLVGLRGRWFGRRGATGPLGIAAVGALFAISFDTFAQATLFATAAQRSGGVHAVLACALVFTAGMLVTDGLNGLWMARLMRRCDRATATASRVMGWLIVAASLATAAFGIGRQLA